METVLGPAFVRQHLPKRPRTAHKGTFGRLAVLAGSRRFRGAACLAAEGALRSGAGIVQVAGIEAVCAAVAARLPCCTLLPCEEDSLGGPVPHVAEVVLQGRPSAVLAGCGLGNTAGIAALVKALLAGHACPLVLDADALNVLAGELDTGREDAVREELGNLLAKSEAPVVLTPHIGEIARLAGISTQQVQQNQGDVALAFAREHGATVVLKSHHTCVAAPDGRLFVNNAAGNAGMAKGGSGDVLAGVIGSLLAQGVDAPVAAATGVWVHAAAGDLAAEQMGLAGLSPADLPMAVAQVLRQFEQ